ncbi:PfkB family carbohydrate kinase [uncultured Roseobacter sp.]|uniref:PfkB family carbohydrate kinase n=1 Tax=uncultured Roseobacter sp. TaxID=114847 RepID=UPI0026054AF7|nr:PfkB family carbohydrate kinase [uncultured Roseobacter sp.]
MSLFVVGALHLDVVLRAPHLPALDETVTGRSVDYVFGGKGGNQAVAAARLGAQVSFAGRAGADSFGDMIRAELKNAGLDHRQLQSDAGPSGMSAAIVDDQGEYGAVIVSAANLNIDADAIVVPESTQLVVLQNEIPQSVNTAVAQKAKALGVQVWLNAAPVRALPDAFVSLVDLIIVNRVEAAAYPSPGMPLLETLGADGVRYDQQFYPGHSVDVVSTHGAGDMFVGALASRAVSGADVAGAISFAQAAAALHISTPLHARADITARKVEDFLAAQRSR